MIELLRRSKLFIILIILIITITYVTPAELISKGVKGVKKIVKIAKSFERASGKSDVFIEVANNIKNSEKILPYSSDLTSSNKLFKDSILPRYIKNWHKGTFNSVKDSMEYHLMKHGKGRTIDQYTSDAMNFYNNNKHLGKPVQLKDGSFGVKIEMGSGKNKIGGYWTNDGKIVTFWD